ncbi:MAG: MBL fold metallo-hydrolase [Acidobacteria bacterium]|nr:MBL fold metallo-hydrolase [Acidobacteriota bacterium]
MFFPTPYTLSLADWKLHLISDGRFRLDGGAMFGVVPKTLWSPVIEPDEKNRIPMALNCLLIQAAGKTILVDTGIGAKEDDKFREIYRMDPVGTLLQQMQLCGVKNTDVDWVINTHLHFDHCGGNTVHDGEGERPTFPNATYFVQRGEMEAARHPDVRSRASYVSRNWESTVPALQLLDGNCELMSGISVFLSPGHTAYHQSVQVERDGQVVVFLGDLMPTIHHISVPWIMGYDLYPLISMDTKKTLLPRMASEQWLLIFEHEPFQPVGRVHGEGRKFVFDAQSDSSGVRDGGN